MIAGVREAWASARPAVGLPAARRSEDYLASHPPRSCFRGRPVPSSIPVAKGAVPVAGGANPVDVDTDQVPGGGILSPHGRSFRGATVASGAGAAAALSNSGRGRGVLGTGLTACSGRTLAYGCCEGAGDDERPWGAQLEGCDLQVVGCDEVAPLWHVRQSQFWFCGMPGRRGWWLTQLCGCRV